MSLQDLVVARVRDGVDRVVAESPSGSQKVRILTYGTERPDEYHYYVKRGHELVRVTVETIER